MADQDRSLDFQMVEHSRDIASACRQIVSIGWVTRGTKPATRDGDDAILIGELIGEVVEHMCGVPQTGKHHQRRAIARPVEDFQRHLGRAADERRLVPGCIDIRCALTHSA